jgi:chromosome segregation ATPase
LQVVVQDIADNPTLQLPSKLKHVIGVVTHWYTSKSDRVEEELAEERANSMIIHSQIETFLQFLARTIPEVGFTTSQVLQDEQIRVAIAGIVQRLRDDCQHLLKCKSIYDEESLELMFLLHVDKMSEAKDAVRLLKDRIENLTQKYRSEKSEWKKRKKALRESGRLQANLLQDLDEKVGDLQSEIVSLTCETDALHRKLEDKQREIESSAQQLVQEKETTRAIQTELENERQLREGLEHANSDLRDTLANYSRESEEQTQQIQDLRSALEELHRRCKEKLKDERMASHARLESALEQMSQKNSEHLSTIQTLNDQLAQMQDRIAQSERLNAELTLRLQKQDTRVTALAAERQREKKAQDSQMKATLLAAESEFQRQLDESQDAVKKLLVLLNQTLTQFLPNVTISEENVDESVRGISREFAAMLDRERKLREILNVSAQESLVDAVLELESHRGQQ